MGPIEKLQQGQHFPGYVGLAIAGSHFVKIEPIAKSIAQGFGHPAPLIIGAHQNRQAEIGGLGPQVDRPLANLGDRLVNIGGPHQLQSQSERRWVGVRLGVVGFCWLNALQLKGWQGRSSANLLGEAGKFPIVRPLHQDVGRFQNDQAAASRSIHLGKPSLRSTGFAKPPKEYRVGRREGGVNRLIGIAHPHQVHRIRGRVDRQLFQQPRLQGRGILRFILKHRKDARSPETSRLRIRQNPQGRQNHIVIVDCIAPLQLGFIGFVETRRDRQTRVAIGGQLRCLAHVLQICGFQTRAFGLAHHR